MSDRLANPRFARRAAVTPVAAARPACSGLVIVPKTAFRAAACVPAIPNAWAVVLASSSRSCAEAAAAPKQPTVPVACHPRL